MNKYVTVISLFSLTACGGGGGSGFSPVPPRGPASPAVVSSNHGVTSLATEVLVGGGGISPVVFRSAATPVSYNGNDYHSYRLEDVKLNVAGNNEINEKYVRFLINERTGEIRGVSQVDTISGGKPVNINRMKDTDGSMTNEFGGPVFEFVHAGTGTVLVRVADDGSMTYDQLDKRYHPVDANTKVRINGRWNRVDEKPELVTKGNDLGLQYSDFGQFNPIYLSRHDEINTGALEKIRNYEKTGEGQYKLDRAGDLDNYDTINGEAVFFAGGYAINGTSINDTLSPENSTGYTGTAIGRVNKDGVTKDFITNNAQLNIDESGNQTLTMPFNTASANADKFYNVTVKNPSAPTFTFGEHDGVDSAYLRDTGTPTNVQQNWKSGFYGIDNPTEAAGTFHYSETVSDTDWKFQGAYGTKINN